MKTKIFLFLVCISEIHAMQMPDLASERLSDEQRRMLKREFPDVFHEPAPKRVKTSHKQSQLQASTEQILSAPGELLSQVQGLITKPMIFYDQKMRDVIEHLKVLIKFQAVDPRSILLVLDLDGTITSSSMPMKEPGFRARAYELLYSMNLLGVKIVISSAWKEPAVSASTFTKLYLHETFGLDASVKLIEERREIMGVSFDCYSMGPLCGVKELNKIWYSHKALASLLSHNAKSFTHVVFLDDNKTHVDFFSQEITTIGLNNTAHVALFHLEPPISDESEESSFEFSE